MYYIDTTEQRRREFMSKKLERELELIDELSNERFSFKSLLKVAELLALEQ